MSAQSGVSTPYPHGRSRAWYALGIFCVVAVLSYTDRQVLSLLVDPLRADLGISDTQISLLQGAAFAVIYSFAGLPLGRAADVLPRRELLIGGVILWCSATVWCGLARSFEELFLARCLVGVGEATLAPSATSMIADFFSSRRRGTATGLFLMSQVLGAGAAVTIAGGVLALASAGAFDEIGFLSDLAPWRVTIVVLGFPGILVVLLLLTVKEPRQQRSAEAQLSLSQALVMLRGQWPVLWPIYAAMAAMSVGDFAFFNWLPAYMLRTLNMTTTEVGVAVGVASVAAAALGAIASGLVSDRLAIKGGVTARLGAALVAACVAIVGGAVAWAPGSTGAIVFFLIWLTMSTASGAIGITAIQEIALPEIRGVAISLIAFCNIILGLSLGASLPALITEHVFGDPQSVGISISVVALPAGILSALLYLVAARAARGHRASVAASLA